MSTEGWGVLYQLIWETRFLTEISLELLGGVGGYPSFRVIYYTNTHLPNNDQTF